MQKVSFKENFKEVKVLGGKTTVVTLQGTIRVPRDFILATPQSTLNWVYDHPTVKFYDGIDTARIVTKGVSVCAEGDVFDAAKGEHIAESRAKIRLYRFMCTLIKKLLFYYTGLIYGVPEGKGDMHTIVNSDFRGGLKEAFRKYSGLLLAESRHLDKILQE